jgi:signal transduction histidine kinase
MEYNRDGSVTMTQPNMVRENFRDYNCVEKAVRVPMDSKFNDAYQDDGPGMSKEDQKLLFEEGVQFNANKLQSGQGSGLGLHFAKGVIELHGGHMTAYSDGVGFGYGTTY